MSRKELRDRLPNIQKLADYINQQEKPEWFMQVLFALVGPKKEAEKK